jgi:hypothetical protein
MIKKHYISWPLVCLFTALFGGLAYAQSDFTVYPLRDPSVCSWPLVQHLREELRNDPNAFLWLLQGGAEAEPAISLSEEASGVSLPFANELLPPPLASYALLIDNSISMWPEWEQAKNALKDVYALLPQGSVIGIHSFSEQLETIRPLAPAPPEERMALDMTGLATSGQNTLLYTSLRTIIEQLAAAPVLRRTIFLFSDGGSEDRALTAGELARLAKETGTVIHTVGFSGAPNRRTGAKRDPRDMDILRYLAEETGGRFLPYENADGLKEAFNKTPALAAGIVSFGAARSLPFGQTRLKLALQQTDVGGKSLRHERTIAVEGARSFDNVLVSISRATGGRDPKLLCSGVLGFLLLLVLVRTLISRRMALRKESQREQEALAARKRQEEQNEQLAGIAKTLEGVLQDAAREEAEKTYGWLIAENGPVYALTSLSIRIGRSAENDVLLPDSFVSNEHAILDFKNGRFVWTDRSPTNATIINGERVAGSRVVCPGDHILCGTTGLRFKPDMSSN